MALIERHGLAVLTTKVVEILDLVDPDDPVLTGERLLDSGELGALSRQLNTTDTILGLPGREEGVVVVVGHLVHQAVLHGVGGLVVDAVFAAGSEEVALLDFVGPDAWESMLVGC